MSLEKWIRRAKNISGRSRPRVKENYVGILIVNGGEDPAEGKWLSLCLSKISRHTKWPNYKIYVWNNNTDDESVPKIVASTPHAVLFHSEPHEKMKHAHAEPLQKLYGIARKDRVEYIITLDTDAFPLKDNWIRHLVEPLDDDTVISGVWRDELNTIAPYVHPSCLCTSVGFIEKNHLRFDDVDIDSDTKVDTLSRFSDIAAKSDRNLFKLCRSNKNQLHYYMGGIYGDLIYHQGAGSRKGVFFWGEDRTDRVFRRNSRIRKTLNHLVFCYREQFVSWLLGMDQINDLPQKRENSLFILGMEGIGFDSLEAVLERCGFCICEEKESCRGLIDSLPDASNRTSEADGISVLEQLSELPVKIQVIGNYQPPIEAAGSLNKHLGLSIEEGLGIWADYNERLVRLHKRFLFPLLKIDLADPERYLSTVAQFAIQSGMDPDLKELKNIPLPHLENEGKVGKNLDKCRETYDYLEENAYRIDNESFAFQILKLKIDLL